MVRLRMNEPNRPSSASRYLTLVFLTLSVVSLLALGALLAQERYLTRGIPAGLPHPIPHGGARLGINVELGQYENDTLVSTLRELNDLGFSYLKQPFYYSESFDWREADRLIDAITAEGLILVPLLDGDPAKGFAPPDDFNAFAAWAGEFADRYGDAITYYIIWDEPNLASHWGGRPVNPGDFAALLAASSAAIRQSDSDAVIVLSPLAPTSETGPDNLSEPLFLSALYRADAADSFDVIAVKPYGFDTGPDDRRVNPDILNFSRSILVREVAENYKDGHKAIWAGNWGWNSLPPGWTGGPSIWGQTTEEQRSAWTIAALERARIEWPWMGVLFLENWEPAVASDDPRWGFSIAGQQTAIDLAQHRDDLPETIAWPGFYYARPDDPAQSFEGAWEFSPEFGADIGQSGDRATFNFWGTEVGLLVRRADFRARLYATVDGQPANALPIDENGAALVLTAGDPAADGLSMELVAHDLEPGPHVLEIVADRGWDQWALKGFAAGYRPPETENTTEVILLSLLTVLFAGLGLWSAKKADWGQGGRRLANAYSRFNDRTQLALTALAASIVGVTGWLTWGQDALGIYRRMGDPGQLAAAATAAALFYVTPIFIVYRIAIAVLLILLVLRPAWGVALIALSMPFYVTPLAKPILGYRFSPVEVFTLVAVTAWAIRTLLDTGCTARQHTLRLSIPALRSADWAVLIFVVITTVSLFFTNQVDVATNEWRIVIMEPALFYFLLRVTRLKERELWVVLDAWLLSGLIVALYGLGQYATGQNLITAEGGLLRLRAFYGSPNNVALYLDRLLPLLIAMLLLGQENQHRTRRFIYGLASLPIFLALIFTFSKGALFLGVPVSLLVVFWLRQRYVGLRAWPWVAAVLTGGLLVLIAALQVPSLAGRLDLFGPTGVFRLNLWRSAFSMFVDRPIFGVGLDNFLYAYRGRYILDAAWQEPNLNHPHNIILDFATRLGILGLLSGVWLIFETGRALAQSVRRSNTLWLPVSVGLSGSLAAIVAHGLVDHSFFLVDLAFSFFLIMGIAIRLLEYSEQAVDPVIGKS
jgi:O-antigen ligase